MSEIDLKNPVLPHAMTALAAVMGEMLASADITLVSDVRTLSLGLRLGKYFDELATETPVMYEVRNRYLRTGDRIRPGEHPGVWMTARFDKGFMIANIRGGIRDLKSGYETKDSSPCFGNHSDRTLGLGDQPTQFNLHTVDLGGTKIAEAWVTDTPRGGGSVAISSLSFEQDVADGMITYRQKFKATNYAYDTFHDSLRAEVKKLVDILP